MSRRLLVVAVGAAAGALVAGLGWAAVSSDSEAAQGETQPLPPQTATVERRDLVQHESVDGTLGYGDPRPLYAKSAGTVTRLRAAGTTVRRGQALVWVDDEPIVLMYGAVAAWRRLDKAAADGPDIEQLEANLAALGHDDGDDLTIDEDWDWATTAAVKRWQEALGAEETGVVELGRIVFLPGARRIGELRTAVAASVQPGGELLETTSTARIVSVDLDTDLQSLVKRGDTVDVELPDGRTAKGRIASVAKVAEAETDPQTGEQSDPTLKVDVRIATGAKTGGLEEAPVDVLLTRESAKDVLTVPVSALVALPTGGYAVEVVERGGVLRVAVETGMFAGTLVEVSGEGLRNGMKVAVPA